MSHMVKAITRLSVLINSDIQSQLPAPLPHTPTSPPAAGHPRCGLTAKRRARGETPTARGPGSGVLACNTVSVMGGSGKLGYTETAENRLSSHGPSSASMAPQAPACGHPSGDLLLRKVPESRWPSTSCAAQHGEQDEPLFHSVSEFKGPV